MGFKSRDFVRQLPDSAHSFKSSTGLWNRLHLDPWFLLIIVCLAGYGLIILYSACGHNLNMVKRQAVFLSAAFMAMIFMAQLKLKFLERNAIWLYVFGILLLVLVLAAGVGAKGAQRWLNLGFTRFQPAEILKLALPLTVAAFFANKMLPPKWMHVCWVLFLLGLPSALILIQPDLGTAILVAASGLIALFLAGLSWRYIFGTVIAIALSAWPMWHFVMHDYQKRRILTLLDPEGDKLGAGWNIIQSKTAIGSGGLEGKGWMQGTQSQLDFLPESHTDFIIAVLSEEFGFYGFLLLMAMYFLLISRGLWIAYQAQSNFSRILAGTLALTFMVYVFVNVSMVSGLLPIVGVPLPLISLGGTSLITLMLGFGLIMAVSTEPKRVIK